MINKFLQSIKKRNLSKNTYLTYESHLRKFRVQEQSFKQIIKQLLNNNYKPKSLKLAKSILSEYWKFTKQYQYVQELEQIKLSKEQKSYKKVFSLDDIKKCLKINKQDTKQIKFYKTILLFYATTGIRAMEIYQLKQINNDLFVISGKGNKNRQICYIEHLWNNIKNKKLPSTKTLRKYLKVFFDNKNVSLHTLRRSFITNFLTSNDNYKRGDMLKIVQDLVGHENIQTTLQYVQITKEQVDDVYKEFFKEFENDK